MKQLKILITVPKTVDALSQWNNEQKNSHQYTHTDGAKIPALVSKEPSPILPQSKAE